MMARKESSPLLTLPPELRNSIYRMVIVFPQSIRFGTSEGKPALLATCKQIHNESVQIFWAENTFEATYLDTDRCHLLQRLNSLGQAKCSSICKLQLSWMVTAAETEEFRKTSDRDQTVQELILDFARPQAAYEGLARDFITLLLESGVRLQCLDFDCCSVRKRVHVDSTIDRRKVLWDVVMEKALRKVKKQMEDEREGIQKNDQDGNACG